MSRVKRTAAHWGSYLIGEGANGPVLTEDANGTASAKIGEGWLDAMRDEQVRIARPAARKGWLAGDGGKGRGHDTYIELSWDEALYHVTTELTRIINHYGNGAVFAGSYGWSSAGRFHHAQSHMRRFLNLIGGHVTQRDTYSHAVAAVLFPHIIGLKLGTLFESMTTWPRIIEHCDIFLAFGGVSARTAQVSSGGTTKHECNEWLGEACARGVEFVNITPQRGDTELPLAEWIPLRPGSDSALILALCYEILRIGAEDRNFLETRTSGWPIFRDYLIGDRDGIPKNADWAASISDIPSAQIRKLARRLPGKRVMISVAWSLQRADHGEQPIWGGLALAAMLGQIGKPGGGFGFGYGSSAHVGRPVRWIRWPSVCQGENPIPDYIPVARTCDMLENPGGMYCYNGEMRQYPRTRLVYWVGGNPFHHHQDLNRFENAWRRPETIIVHEHSWTATARRADIVLPATCALERDDFMLNSRDNTIIAMSAALPPFGQSRNDYAIFKDLAYRMGVGDRFTEGLNEKQLLESLWEQCRSTAQSEGVTLPEYKEFRSFGRIDIPDVVENRNFLSEFSIDPDTHPLDTESGKITLYNNKIADMGLEDCPGYPAWLAPIEWLGTADIGEFHLISGQPAHRLHGQLDNSSGAKAEKYMGRATCVLHPDAAEKVGVEAGDVVCLSSHRGECLAAVALSDAIRTDCVALPTGAWFDPQNIAGRRIDVHGNPNVLTINKGASKLSQGSIGHTAIVRINRWNRPLPPVLSLSVPPLS